MTAIKRSILSHKTYSNILKDNFLNYKIDTINN
nr:MAG TPA: hypothetical protein [Caudoviricetes sp.]